MLDDTHINLARISRELTEQKAGKPLFIFLTPAYGAIVPYLKKAGLQEGVDFLPGLPILRAYQTQVMPEGKFLLKRI